MTALTHRRFQPIAQPARLRAALLAFLTRVARRQGGTPRAGNGLGGMTAARSLARAEVLPSARPHARWRTVTGDDGRRRLEAHWHSGA